MSLYRVPESYPFVGPCRYCGLPAKLAGQRGFPAEPYYQHPSDDRCIADLRANLDEARKDTERLNWLERHDYSLMCWNVLGDPKTRKVDKPDNGWSITLGEPDDDIVADTARECLDMAGDLHPTSTEPAP